MKNKINILLLDINSMFNRSYFASEFSEKRDYDANGDDITAILALGKMINKLIKVYEPRFIVGCIDDMSGKYFRHDIYPEYKGTREEKREDFYILRKRLPKYLQSLNIAVDIKESYEADDLIASYVKMINNKGNSNYHTIIVSQDNDLKLLINDNISCLQRKQHIDMLITKEVFEESLDGLSKDNFLGVKVLTGDVSDNLPGAKGIGEKTAIKLLKKHNNLHELIAFAKDNPNENKSYQKIIDNKDNIIRNYQLMKLNDDIQVLSAKEIMYPIKKED